MEPSPTRWPLFAALVAGVTAVGLLWYLVLANPKGEAVPASGGRYVEGVSRAPDRMNPLFAGANPVDGDLATLMFSGLVRLSPDGTPIPDLASRWEITGNGQSIVFHLRSGVAWHDGTPFTATDVIFTYDAIADPAFKGDPALAQLMDGVVVTARDDLTVEFVLEQAYSPFLAYLTVGILPEHLLRDFDANELYNAAFNSNPVGTGAYRFAGRTSRGVILKSNPTFYLGPPRISTMEFRTYEDESSLAEAARLRELDGALLPPETPPSEVEFLERDERLVLHQLAATSLNIIYLDIRSPLFDDQQVRLALLRAIDIQGLVNDVAGGGVPCEAGIPHSSWAYTPAETPTFDAGAAATTLETAGWARGSDGIRRKGGTRLAFALSTSNEPYRVNLAETVAQQWRAIGADVTVQPIDSATYINEHLLTRSFEAALAEIDPGPDPDPYPFWHSSQVVGTGRNLAGYVNSDVDDALERARQTTDTQRRIELYEQFTGYFIRDTPALPLFSPVRTYVQDAEVQGYNESLLFTPASRFSNVNEWYVRTRVE